MSGTNGFGLWVNYVKCLWRSESKSSTFPCGCIDFANNSLNILFLLDTGSKSIRLFDVSLSGEVLQTKHNSHKLCTCIVKRLPIVVTVSRRRLWSPGILRDYIRALWLKCKKGDIDNTVQASAFWALNDLSSDIKSSTCLHSSARRRSVYRTWLVDDIILFNFDITECCSLVSILMSEINV